MSPRITGLGLVTPLGRSVSQTWTSLIEGRSISDHSAIPPLDTARPRVVSLAIEAAREAIANAGWDVPTLQEETAVVVGTSKGPVESWTTTAPPPTSDNQLTMEGRCEFGLSELSSSVAAGVGLLDAPRLTLSAACASGLHALIRACMMIQSGEARRVLVVAAEASVHSLFLASFERLGVLSPSGTPCRPFDQNRQGFLMSDAAAAVCLEASTAPGVYVDRFAMGGDATHLTGTRSDGRVLAKLVGRVMFEKIDLIHAHGTGTVLNDAIELSVLQQLMAGSSSNTESPSLYSHKGALGHTLGASGLVSVVVNALCHLHGRMPGNINTVLPMDHTGLRMPHEASFRHVRRSMVIAAGFGGPIAVVAFKTCSSAR